MVQPFRASVGRTRVTKAVNPSEAAFTASVRSQMQGIIDEYIGFINYMESTSPELLKSALEPTFELSQTYCPVKSGALKDSGFLEVEGHKGGATVALGYARGGFPDYAVFVHENQEMQHVPPTRSKFLEAALEEDWGNVVQRIGSGYKEAVGV